ncbi:HNH endonuclease [Tumebacillus permanentifrigoris]|uniref:Putative HNH nuclease YajD n=1 Tax=Tumebacillus permanentifrigoris TaxID=378543 RepID=A0A316D5A7_9BACL|nr:HNH endonuclease signature motif containing protein [Tumebacillus permanentifrigoris]PWK05315.1 5-methylcytosine-specific restriction protein A [Tumebacillus permanentifrigoris]
MPPKPKKPCAQPRCSTLTIEKYCAQHAHKQAEQTAEKDAHYDRLHRDPKATAFYKSMPWRHMRIYIKRRDVGLCQICLRDKRITAGTLVHHKVPLLNDWDRRLDPTNLELVCSPCHNRIHNMMKGGI